MRKRLYTLEELETYFKKHGMEWKGRVFDIYLIKGKHGEDKYVIDDFDYAEQKGGYSYFIFDFTYDSVDWKNIEEAVRLHNESHDDKINLDGNVIARYIITSIVIERKYGVKQGGHDDA